MTVEQKVASELARWLPATGKLVVGVSGGADSMALMHLLHQLVPLSIRRLIIVHINHGLRKRAADRDQQLVVKQANHLGLTCHCFKRAIKTLAAQQKCSVEDMGRQVRHACYLQVAKQARAVAVILAHHRDDQIETFLMRLIRGSSGKGLQAMAKKRLFPQTGSRVWLIRPLLDCSKQELRDYLTARHLTWREDESNDQPIYQRNKIRHLLLPLIKKEFNPEFDKILGQTIAALTRNQEYLDAEIRKKRRQLVRAAIGSDLQVDRLRFLRLAPAIQWGLLSLLWDEVGLPQKSSQHLQRLLEAIKQNQKLVSLPGKWQGQCYQAYFSFLPRRKIKTIPAKPFPLTKENNFIAPLGLRVKIKKIPKVVKIVHQRQATSVMLDQAKVDHLYVRVARPADELSPLGMAGKNKRVKKILSELKLTMAQRRCWPVLTNGKEIIWVYQGPIADSVKVTAQTKSCLVIKMEMDGPTRC